MLTNFDQLLANKVATTSEITANNLFQLIAKG